MRRCRLFVLAAFLIACARPTTDDPSARSVVREFYTTAIARHVTGAPTAPQLAALAPYLSDTLRALLGAARRRTEADVARDRNEKPAFVEGDLFSSLFEGPNAVEVLADSARGDQRVVTVRMTANTSSPAVVWIDRVVLTKERGRYVIDDVEYTGPWDFANKGTLRTSLVSGIGNPE